MVESKAKEYVRKGKNLGGNLTGWRQTRKIGEMLRRSTRK
jgi:hypothetical protein